MTKFVANAISPRLSQWAWGFGILEPLKQQTDFALRQCVIGLARGTLTVLEIELRQRLWEQFQ